MTFKQLVDVIHYGIQFQADFREESCSSYLVGVIETTAFIAACIIVQEFGLDEGIGGQDVDSALGLDEYPNRTTIEKRLRKLFKELELDTREK